MRAKPVVEQIRAAVGRVVVGRHIHDLDRQTADRGVIGDHPAHEQQLVVGVRREDQNVDAFVRARPDLDVLRRAARRIGRDLGDHHALRQRELNRFGRQVKADVFVEIAVRSACPALASGRKRPLAGIAAEDHIQRSDFFLRTERDRRPGGEELVSLIGAVAKPCGDARRGLGRKGQGLRRGFGGGLRGRLGGGRRCRERRRRRRPGGGSGRFERRALCARGEKQGKTNQNRQRPFHSFTHSKQCHSSSQ